MGLYEIMFIIRPDLETEEHEEVLNELKSTISKNRGTVEKAIDWQKRRLAYEINNYQEGHYYLLYFSGSGEIIPEIEHFFRVSDAVIRYIVVRTDEQALEDAAATEEAAEASEAGESPEPGEAAPAEEIEEAGETGAGEQGGDSEEKQEEKSE